ncbi:hypothetical protein O3M35_012058 [Rhynocoris fuscipes]|uniref:Orange domain-containing protein n=1 Tax=Rhynocoris fuscipes TaxID=488301 RepID=A0AAW1CSQ3_9HEMI
MTVKHVESLQRHQAALTAAADPTVVNKFKAGWSECVTEVGRFPGIEAAVKRRLVDHLSTCLEDRGEISPPPSKLTTTTGSLGQVVLPAGPSPSPPTIATIATVTTSSASNQQPLNHQAAHHVIHRRETGVLALVPTRLSNGDIALVLPSPPPLVPASSQQPLCLAISKQDAEKPWRPW